ncbi:MAG: hypothetical protein SPJ52_00870 [Candidatus Enterosoma sp.]|nr:hypothetical protein [bacterium]MDY5865691.1 hypothetical protein [Candidatus Enterosoma sp.]
MSLSYKFLDSSGDALSFFICEDYSFSILHLTGYLDTINSSHLDTYFFFDISKLSYRSIIVILKFDNDVKRLYTDVICKISSYLKAYYAPVFKVIKDLLCAIKDKNVAEKKNLVPAIYVQ